VEERQPMRAMHRELRDVARAATPTHHRLRTRIAAIALYTFGVDAVASIAIFFFERHASGTKIHTIGDSLFWTTTQLLTVSSQLPNPLSTGGRIVDVFLQMWAISVVATLAASFGAFFHRRELERRGVDAGVA
jgi:hypothetical protein